MGSKALHPQLKDKAIMVFKYLAQGSSIPTNQTAQQQYSMKCVHGVCRTKLSRCMYHISMQKIIMQVFIIHGVQNSNNCPNSCLPNNKDEESEDFYPLKGSTIKKNRWTSTDHPAEKRIHLLFIQLDCLCPYGSFTICFTSHKQRLTQE